MTEESGAQRLSREQLNHWREKDFGLFLHFGLSTYDPENKGLSETLPASRYAPDALDVDQWLRVAADCGMRYAVLTAKHATGFCLWPSRHTDYHVGASGCKTDVIEEYVTACDKHGVAAGLYLGSRDHHHRFGSVPKSKTVKTPHQHAINLHTGALADGTNLTRMSAFTTAEYHEFMEKLLEELLTQYGPVFEVWLDMPTVLGLPGRKRLYNKIKALQPDTVVAMNHSFGDGTILNVDYAWPTDVLTLENTLPPYPRYNPWFSLQVDGEEPAPFFVPGETCEPIGRSWFWSDRDELPSVRELLGRRLVCHERGVNWLLNVPPDRHGRLAADYVTLLQNMTRQAATLGL